MSEHTTESESRSVVDVLVQLHPTDQRFVDMRYLQFLFLLFDVHVVVGNLELRFWAQHHRENLH